MNDDLDALHISDSALHEKVKSIIPSLGVVSENLGGKTSYYDVPAGATTLNDLIEYKQMEFWRGEAFKALYALPERAARSADSDASELRELNKIIYYCYRRIQMLEKLSTIAK